MREHLLDDINKALDSIRPFLNADGGDVELIGVDENMTVSIKWLGNCSSCDMRLMTLKAGLEDSIRKYVPEIKEVIAING